LLEEMLGNLIDNAIRYTPPGGEATVRVVRGANAAIVEVEDNGPGIPESERAQVMERFQRGSNTAQTPGSGLGLAIVREIAVTHGAEVRLEAGHDGKGTRARVVLPSPG
jgi:two-component system sensor histidine kinase TctE